jgi:hypothetical protein
MGYWIGISLGIGNLQYVKTSYGIGFDIIYFPNSVNANTKLPRRAKDAKCISFSGASMVWLSSKFLLVFCLSDMKSRTAQFESKKTLT